MTQEKTILLHNFVERTTANGPGTRSIFWVQGCTLGCAGCFNPATHAPILADASKAKTPEELIAMVPEDVQGISISGGEPFQQSLTALLHLLNLAKERSLTVVMFTGYEFGELLQQNSKEEIALALQIIQKTDMLIAGRYEQQLQSTKPLLGSDNQNIYYPTGRYSDKDLSLVSKLELIFNIEDNTKTKTGIGVPKGKNK
jgi:anaerobic ribonucleoside-triphosphate reductase activating protein